MIFIQIAQLDEKGEANLCVSELRVWVDHVSAFSKRGGNDSPFLLFIAVRIGRNYRSYEVATADGLNFLFRASFFTLQALACKLAECMHYE